MVVQGKDGVTTIYITTVDELKQFRDDVNSGTNTNANVYLLADLNLSGETNWIPIGNSDEHAFTGTFQGEGHVISNLKINTPNEGVQGLFGTLKNHATINNVGIVDSSIKGKNSVGGIVGYLKNSNIKNCYISNSTVSGEKNVGGIVGSMWNDDFNDDDVLNGVMEKCYNDANVTGDYYVGGICGGGFYLNMQFCYNKGSIIGLQYNTVGEQGKAGSGVGGLVGCTECGILKDCYNLGKVTSKGDCVGAICGENIESEGKDFIRESYYLKGTCDKCCYGCSGECAKKKNEQEMKESNFLNSIKGDKENIWKEKEGINDGYPILFWQDPIAAPNGWIDGGKQGENEYYVNTTGLWVKIETKNYNTRYFAFRNGVVSGCYGTDKKNGWCGVNQVYNGLRRVEAYYIDEEGTRVSEIRTLELKIDTKAPTFSIEASSSDLSITAKVDNLNDNYSGIPTDNIYKYYIGTSEDNLELKAIENIPSHTFTEDIKEGTTYYIKVEVADNAGNIKAMTASAKTKIYVKSVNVTPELEDVEVGKTLELTGTVTPDNATNNDLIWTSNNSDIATVGDNGQVLGIKEGTVTITATGENGIHDTSTVTVVPRKLEANVKTDLTISEEVWNEHKATVTVTNNKQNTYTVEYKIGEDNDVWMPLGEGNKIEGLLHGQTVYARLADGEYHTQPVSKKIIDDEDPTLTVTGNPDSWQSGAVTLNISCNDTKSGLAEVTVNGKPIGIDGTSATYIATDNETCQIIAKDRAGNITTHEEQINKIDNTKPSIKVNKSTDTKTKDNVILYINPTDTQSGIKEVKVENNKVNENNNKYEYTIQQNGTYTITVTDNAGNVDKQTIAVDNIDKTPPTLTVKYTTNYDSNFVTAQIIADEEIQGKSEWTLSEEKYRLSKIYFRNKTESVTVYDIVGNSAIANIDTKNMIDEEELQIEDITYSPTTPTNGNVTVTIKVNKRVKPVNGWNISDDGKTLTKVYTKNDSDRVMLQDLVGNTKVQEVNVNNIDKTAPIVDVQYSETVKTNQGVIVILTSDEEIGTYEPTDEWTLSDDKKTLTKTFDENAVENVKITDKAGNTTTKKVSVTNIDKTLPTKPTMKIIEGDLGENGWYVTDVVIQVTAGKELESGISHTAYKIIEKGKEDEAKEVIIDDGTSFRLENEGEYTIKAYTYDNANNKAEVEAPLQVNIDKNPPTDVNLTQGDIKTNSFTVNATATDVPSGIASYDFYVNNELKQSELKTEFVQTELKQNETYTVYVIVKDNAGNKTKSNEITIKTTMVPGGGDDTSQVKPDPTNPNKPQQPEVTPIDPDTKKPQGAGEEVQEVNYNIQATPVEWSEEEATTTLSIVDQYKADYKIEYQINGTDENGWTQGEEEDITDAGTKITGLKHGDKIYARLTDGENYGPYIIYIVLDKENPNEFEVNIDEITTDGFTIKAQATDDESGIAGYEYYVDDIKVGESEEGEYKVTGLTQGKEYTVKVIAIDRGGNKTEEEAEGAITTKTMPEVTGSTDPKDPGYDPNAPVIDPEDPDYKYDKDDPYSPDVNDPHKPIKPEYTKGMNIEVTPAIWENEKAKITLSTKTDYEIECQVNGTYEGNWTIGNTVEGLSHGDIVYARLTDKTNASDYIAVIILDKTAPSKPTIEVIGQKASYDVYKNQVKINITRGNDNESGIEKTVYTVNGEEKETTEDIATIILNESGEYTITAYSQDRGQNKSEEETVTIKVQVDEKEYFTSDIYEIEEENLYISRIKPNTTYEEFRKHIFTNLEYEVIRKDDSQNKEIAKEELMQTGDLLKVKDKTYKLVVIGDINGDGECDITDLAKLEHHIIKEINLSGIQAKAADINNDKEQDITDLAKMVRYIIGEITF